MSERQRHHEFGPSDPNIGIYNELARLRAVAVWGQLGTEASLAQLYPPTVSLFHDEMDVLKARNESVRFANLLRDKGVVVYQVRDELAKLLPDVMMHKSSVLDALIAKAVEIQNRTGKSKHLIDDEIVELVEQDIELYGQDKALMLNRVLSLDSKFPMGNLIYARDQMNVLLGTRFASTMAKPIRKPEVDLYEKVYQQGLGLPAPVTIPQGETFEGGDAYIHDGIVYVGVGARTTLGAAIHIYKTLAGQLSQTGLEFVIVQDLGVEKRSFKEQMDFMHLDTFSMPVAPGKIMLCEEEGSRRKTLSVDTSTGTLIDTGLSFLRFLEEQGQEVMSVPLEEQRFFGCNFLNLDACTAFVPLESNTRTNGQLEEAGKDVELVDLLESTKGYGGPHCMTGQLLREDP